MKFSRLSRFYSVFLLCLGCAAALSQAQDPAPMSYNAPTDRGIHPPPALPLMGPAGSVITDPTFGSRILRATDANSIPTQPGAHFVTSSGGFQSVWNADSTKFVILTLGGQHLIVALDPTAFKASLMQDPRKPGQPRVFPFGWFSSQDPNLLYGMQGHKITSYNLQTNTYTPLFNVDLAQPTKQYFGLLSVDQSDTRFTVAFGGIQDTFHYVVVWDKSTGQYALLDTRENWIQPFASTQHVPTNLPPSKGIHASYIDRSGRYVYVGLQGVPRGGGFYWDLQTGQIEHLTDHWSGHSVMGFGNQINNSGTADGTGSQGWWIRSLDNKINEPNLISPDPGKPHSWHTDSHLSWANAQPDRLVPCLVSSYLAPRPPQTYDQPWQGEIFAIETDGAAQKIWRFAHHRSRVTQGSASGGFWDSPRGNVSPNGRYFAFTSNWEQTLGTDPKGKFRQDVFIVELK